MKSKFLVFLLLGLILACNIPISQPNTGISPILTLTAGARSNSTALPSDDMRENISGLSESYTIQSGDTLPALSSRFQISQKVIIQNNPASQLDERQTTLPPGTVLSLDKNENSNPEGLPLIIPNTYFVYGPTQMDFDMDLFVNQSDGWLKYYRDNSSGNDVSGIQIVKGTADNYSISPKILLAILEYHLHALSDPNLPSSFSLGNTDSSRKTLGRQLSWAANALNNGYYGWREGVQTNFNDSSGNLIKPDPKTNAASIAFMYYLSRYLSGNELQKAGSNDGFTATYQTLFGPIDWAADNKYPLIPPNLHQPPLVLPLESNVKWAFTGGPHSGWGIGFPYAAIDFAPPSENAGCDTSPYWVNAAADGVISRLEGGSLILDLDGDGKSQTGWTILYLHISPGENISVGSAIKLGDLLGHPSCLGGSSSGRNIHIARLYNGEWIPAGGIIPLLLGDWVASYGEKEYKGSLTRGESQLISSSSGEWFSQLPVNQK
jgi:LasA protease